MLVFGCTLAHINAILRHCTTSVTGEFPSQSPVTRSFCAFFDLRLNKLLNKQSWCWWFETPSHSICRHYNGYFCYNWWLMANMLWNMGLKTIYGRREAMLPVTNKCDRDHNHLCIISWEIYHYMIYIWYILYLLLRYSLSMFAMNDIIIAMSLRLVLSDTLWRNHAKYLMHDWPLTR